MARLQAPAAPKVAEMHGRHRARLGNEEVHSPHVQPLRRLGLLGYVAGSECGAAEGLHTLLLELVSLLKVLIVKRVRTPQIPQE